jgi:hypothetical protein
MRVVSPFLLVVLQLALSACGPEPAPPEIIEPVEKLDDGQACIRGEECEGGVCYPGFLGFRDGYCTTEACETDADCAGDAACLSFIDGSSACFASCGEGCRDGYGCVEAGGASVCSPGDADLDSIVLEPDAPFSDTLQTLGADCMPRAVDASRWAFDFSLGDMAASFMFVPFVAEGEVAFERIVTPDAALRREEYRHHNTRFEDLGTPGREAFGTFGTVSFDWPVLVPFAPQFDELVVPGGSYTIEVSTTGAVPCLYVVESDAAGTAIDLDVYFVTEVGPSAAEARAAGDFAEALEEADRHFAAAQLKLGDVRYHDAAADVIERFAIVRDLRDIDLLTATGSPRGPSLDEHLTVDVFIVDSIVFDGVTALGVSASVPGPAGMHGNLSNGLVFSAPDLGNDNELVGQVLAHELAHYLGLRHTTELAHGTGTEFEAELDADLGTTDPILDTPTCTNVSRTGSRCPDYDNLMFPIIQSLPDDATLTLSPGQGSVLRRSPLVK